MKRKSTPKRFTSKRRRVIKKKRYAFKRKGRGRNRALVQVGFPRQQAVKLRYVSTVSINPAATQLGYHFFRANSLYDPDYTSAGHQPMTYDMWGTLYNHYVVVGSRITVTFGGDGSTGQTPLIYGVALTDDPTSTSNPTTLLENGTTGYRITSPNGPGQLARCPRYSKGFSAKRFFSVVNPTDNVTRIGASISADPTEVAFFAVFVGPLPDTAYDIGTMLCTIQIEYFALFSEPKEQAQS